jgi:ATP-dependent helicase HepA
MHIVWCPQQRVLSQAEPELGAGLVKEINNDIGCLDVLFPLCLENRRYSLKSAPLKRLLYTVGQSISSDGIKYHVVEEVLFSNGIACYRCGTNSFWEYELDSGPNLDENQQLYNAEICEYKSFDLRCSAWSIRETIFNNKAASFLSAKADLLPHQIYLTNKLLSQKDPRAILSDEVGLGKTVEAGLIYAGLRAKGQANSVLIVVPDNLVHQWTLELYSKFGDLFTVLTNERCDHEQKSQGLSPFEANQKIICSLDLFLSSLQRCQQVCERKWDMVIIDEAHNFSWDTDTKSPQWLLASNLSKQCKSLLLLTATPRQKGLSTFYGLLKLIDPQKYKNFREFLEQVDRDVDISQYASIIHETSSLSIEVKNLLEYALPANTNLHRSLNTKPINIEKILNLLVQDSALGTYYFRNRRNRLKLNTNRTLISIGLEASCEQKNTLIAQSLLSDKIILNYASGRSWYEEDRISIDKNPKFLWIKDFVTNSIKNDKCIVFCKQQTSAKALYKFLSADNKKYKDKVIMLFCDDMDSVERDRVVASFADFNGSGLLIVSKIGEEGRNFQFARKMILYDLPTTPENLEQRIGRLDRLGQKGNVEIFAPWLKDTPEEVLYTWYKDAIDAFSSASASNIELNGEVFEDCAEKILDACKSYFPSAENYKKRKAINVDLIEHTKSLKNKFLDSYKDSADILVDLNSYNSKLAQKLTEDLENLEDNPALEFFIQELFDFYNLDYEEYDKRGSLLVRRDSAAAIEGLIPETRQATDIVYAFDRRTALLYENSIFLTYGSPDVDIMLESVLGKDHGKLSMCKTKDSTFEHNMYVEVIYAFDTRSINKIALSPLSLPIYKKIVVNNKGIVVNDFSLKNNLTQNVFQQEAENIFQKIKPNLSSFLQEAQKEIDKWLAYEKNKSIDDFLDGLNMKIDALRFVIVDR